MNVINVAKKIKYIFRYLFGVIRAHINIIISVTQEKIVLHITIIFLKSNTVHYLIIPSSVTSGLLHYLVHYFCITPFA